MNIRTEEQKARRAAQRQGLRLVKSRRRDPRAVDYGTYMLVDGSRNIVAGEHMFLEAVQTCLADGAASSAERRALGLVRGLEYDVDAPESLEELRELALAHYDSINACELDAEAVSDGYVDRITVNYLRHERTTYEWNLWEMQRRQGAVPWSDATTRAYAIIRRETMDSIAARFPSLAGACAALRPARRGW